MSGEFATAAHRGDGKGLARLRVLIGTALIGAALALPGAGQAASVSITVQQFGKGLIADAKAAQSLFLGSNGILATEDFEGFSATPIQSGGTPAVNPTVNPVATAVGSFTSRGDGSSCGASCVTPSADLEVRSADFPNTIYGRYNTTDGGQNFLGSNDTEGMTWGISGLGAFKMISFLLTDVDDVGLPGFGISVAGDATGATATPYFAGKQSNGKITLVTMSFDDYVSNLTVSLFSDAGDGFGFDDAVLAGTRAPSPVPLPAAGLLLLGGLGGLAALRRRKTA